MSFVIGMLKCINEEEVTHTHTQFFSSSSTAAQYSMILGTHPRYLHCLQPPIQTFAMALFSFLGHYICLAIVSCLLLFWLWSFIESRVTDLFLKLHDSDLRTLFMKQRTMAKSIFSCAFDFLHFQDLLGTFSKVSLSDLLENDYWDHRFWTSAGAKHFVVFKIVTFENIFWK